MNFFSFALVYVYLQFHRIFFFLCVSLIFIFFFIQMQIIYIYKTKRNTALRDCERNEFSDLEGGRNSFLSSEVG